MSRFKHFPDHRFKHFPKGKLQGSIHPYGFTGCYCWFDPAFGITRSGSDISRWTDRIRSYSFSQGNASFQPVFVSSLVNFNSNPALLFSGLCIISGSFIPVSPSMTIAFVVYPLAASATANNFLSDASPSSGTTHRIKVQGGASGVVGTGVYSGVADPMTAVKVSTFKANAPQIVVISAGGNIAVNGTIYSTSAWNPSAAFALMGGLTGGSNSHNLQGYVGELLFYNRSFTDAEMLQLSETINEKYQIY